MACVVGGYIVLIWSDREQDKGDILCPGAPMGPYPPPPPAPPDYDGQEGGGRGEGRTAGEDQSSGVLDALQMKGR
jgi:hypothetical protein